MEMWRCVLQSSTRKYDYKEISLQALGAYAVIYMNSAEQHHGLQDSAHGLVGMPECSYAQLRVLTWVQLLFASIWDESVKDSV